MRLLILYFFFLPLSVFAHEDPSSPISLIEKRVLAHLEIHDLRSAQEEWQEGMTRFPEAPELYKLALSVFAQAGEESKMLMAWKHYADAVENPYEASEALETLAWGVIEKAHQSPSPMTRAMAAIAALLSQSNHGVKILHKSMQDSNALVRGVTVQLAGKMRDRLLCQEMLKVLRQDPVWNVRLAAIGAVGSMGIREAQPDLEAILAKEGSLPEEKAAAIQSLLQLMQMAPEKEVERLSCSPRAGLRLLACQTVLEFSDQDHVKEILPLLQDPRAEVRAATVEVLGALRVKEGNGRSIREAILPLLSDVNSHVSVAAAWLLTLHHPEEGQFFLRKALNAPSLEKRRLASAALVATGSYGQPLLEEAFFLARDPYVKVNLALGLIAQRLQTQAACQAIYEALQNHRELWMWKTHDLFRTLAPSTISHREEIPQYPQVVDQLVRLELMQVLAFMQDGRAQTILKAFLKERPFGTTGLAAGLLLTEGDDQALDMVRDLLGKEEDPQIRVQAAMILGLWGNDPAALETLHGAYDGADRHTQEKILESLGQIGAKGSIPFLVKQCLNPHQHLRLIAASSLLLCLNH